MKEIKLSPILIENKINPNTYFYSRRHKNKQFAFGELFEINLYENLLLWAKEDSHIRWVCSKQFNKKELKDGLGRNDYGQIVYYVDYLSFAEFDMLFQYDDILVNIEATVTNNPGTMQSKYFKKINRNHFMLKTMYQTEKVHTVFLLTEEPDEKLVFPENTSYAVVKTFFRDLDYSKKPSKQISRPLSKMYKREVKKIDYHRIFLKFHKTINYKFYREEKDSAINFLQKDLFFERAFLGYIDREILDIDLIPERVRRVYICLNNNNTYTLFYFVKNKVFEVLKLDGEMSVEEKRNRYSRSRKMLIFLKQKKLLYGLSKKKILKLFENSDYVINEDLFVRRISR